MEGLEAECQKKTCCTKEGEHEEGEVLEVSVFQSHHIIRYRNTSGKTVHTGSGLALSQVVGASIPVVRNAFLETPSSCSRLLHFHLRCTEGLEVSKVPLCGQHSNDWCTSTTNA